MSEDAAPTVDLSLERLVHLDQRFDEHEGGALRDRWEFGRQMLATRDGAGRLPNGYLSELVGRTRKRRREVAKALKRIPDPDASTEPQPVPEGQFGTIVADPPWRYGNTSTEPDDSAPAPISSGGGSSSETTTTPPVDALRERGWPGNPSTLGRPRRPEPGCCLG